MSEKEVASLKDPELIARFRMLDAEDEFGTIEPGKRADLLILGASPLDDIRNTRSLETVIAEGRVVDRDALPVRIP